MKKENQLKTLNNKEHKNFSHLAYYEEILRRVLHIQFVKASGKASTSFSLAQAWICLAGAWETIIILTAKKKFKSSSKWK